MLSLESSTLEQVMSGLNELLKYMRQSLCGLANLHALNIVHRDIKPDNIMIDSQGSIVLIDFGFARNVTQYPHTPEAMSYRYASPESLLGSGDYDHRSDIWSLGCTFLEMLLGLNPFDRLDPFCLTNVHGTPQHPTRCGADQLASIMKCFPLPKRNKRLKYSITKALHSTPADHFPISSRLPELVLLHLQKNYIKRWANLSPEFTSLYESALGLTMKMLTVDANLRPNVCDYLQHSLFTTFQPEILDSLVLAPRTFTWPDNSFPLGRTVDPKDVLFAYYHKVLCRFFHDQYVCPCTSQCNDRMQKYSSYFPSNVVLDPVELLKPDPFNDLLTNVLNRTIELDLLVNRYAQYRSQFSGNIDSFQKLNMTEERQKILSETVPEMIPLVNALLQHKQQRLVDITTLWNFFSSQIDFLHLRCSLGFSDYRALPRILQYFGLVNIIPEITVRHNLAEKENLSVRQYVNVCVTYALKLGRRILQNKKTLFAAKPFQFFETTDGTQYSVYLYKRCLNPLIPLPNYKSVFGQRTRDVLFSFMKQNVDKPTEHLLESVPGFSSLFRNPIVMPVEVTSKYNTIEKLTIDSTNISNSQILTSFSSVIVLNDNSPTDFTNMLCFIDYNIYQSTLFEKVPIEAYKTVMSFSFVEPFQQVLICQAILLVIKNIISAKDTVPYPHSVRQHAPIHHSEENTISQAIEMVRNIHSDGRIDNFTTIISAYHKTYFDALCKAIGDGFVSIHYEPVKIIRTSKLADYEKYQSQHPFVLSSMSSSPGI